jgi:hypothetical protein
MIFIPSLGMDCFETYYLANILNARDKNTPMKILILWCLLLGIQLQTLAQNPMTDPVPYWVQLERERLGFTPPKPKPQFNPQRFQQAADTEMVRVNAEFAWIKRRAGQKRKFKSKK